MQAVSRASGNGRSFRYVCATYWNRGATICNNGLMADMPVVDAAVRAFFQTEVLRPSIVARALDRVVDIPQRDEHGHAARAARLDAQVARLDRELANLAETDVKATCNASGLLKSSAGGNPTNAAISSNLCNVTVPAASASTRAD
jgi:hypothetical protein